MAEYAIRFVLGGAVVSAFAVLGDVLRPKSFAGLFALATLGLAFLGTVIAFTPTSVAAWLIYKRSAWRRRLS